MLATIPHVIPAIYTTMPGAAPVVDVDTGGYDVMIGGHGFRLATDQQNYYARATEPTTVRRFDDSLEPGEQSLAPLPWIKSQSSFHAGAGQLNLEQGFTSFQYQQEQIEHIRFDDCLGVDVWTPGQVTRLPDCRFFDFGFESTSVVTAVVGGVDYAVIGGDGGLYMASWPSGPDADPTVEAVDLTDPTLGGAANCNFTSVTTDGENYYALVQLASVGSNTGILTYVVSGAVGSTDKPNIMYAVEPATSPVRHNLCTNPSFESGTAGWTAGSGVTQTSDATRSKFGSRSLKLTATMLPDESKLTQFTFNSIIDTTYAISLYVYFESLSNPHGGASLRAGSGTDPFTMLSATATTGGWVRMFGTFTATDTTTTIALVSANSPQSMTMYVDGVLIEANGSSGAGEYFDGDTTDTTKYNYQWDGAQYLSASTALPVVDPVSVPGIIGWAKERLIGALGPSVYELPPVLGGFASLPAAKYTHPLRSCQWTAISESPTAILLSNLVGGQSNILAFTLDSSGGTPSLSGGATIATLPVGETILSMKSYLASFLGVGTTSGVRVGTFDTYTGNLKMGPLTVAAQHPVQAIAGRDRFVYAGYTDQQADGKTGLVRVDLSMVVDAAGRNAYAPDLRPPTTAPLGTGAVTGIGVLPTGNRILFVTPEGLFVEGDGPGADGESWLRTSRIRYDTAEQKLFKLGRVHGSLDVSSIQVTGISPFNADQNLGTFGFVVHQDPGEFGLPPGLHEWIQLKFTLDGSACVLSSYMVKAYPAPAVQDVIQLTVNCFTNETDRFGLDVTDPEQPRRRLQNIIDLKNVGNEVRYVEFTNQGAVAELVLIDQLEFRSYSRPTVNDDFGGYLTLKLRKTTI